MAVVQVARGAFRFNTVRLGASISRSNISTANAAAVDQYQGWSSAVSAALTANPDSPKFCPASAAPTVPECRTARPVLAPALIPDTIRSGGGPKAPSRATTTV